MIRVLIVDDNGDVRSALKQIIHKTPDIVVGAEAGTGHDALRRIDEQEFDIVTLDITLPDGSGLELLKRIKRRKPDLRVLMVSIHPEELYAAPALRAGASGYITKGSAADQLVKAIRQVSSGSFYLGPSIAQQIGVQNADDSEGPVDGVHLRNATSE